VKRIFFILFFPLVLFAEKAIIEQVYPEFENPWFTGPLIAQSPVVVPLGHVNYEPYLYATAIPGYYDTHWKTAPSPHNFWTYSLQPLVEVGLTSWMDFEIIPALYYNYDHHAAHWGFGDLLLQLNFQLLHIPHNPWIPVILFSLGETFPTGKYKKFNPTKNGVQATGGGSFQTYAALTIGKIIHLSGIHFIDARLYLEYNLPAPTRLKGFNTYGGAADTDARFFPAQSFTADLGLEFTLAQNWAFACDLIGIWFTKSHFSGNQGTILGVPASFGTLPAARFEIAPAIEYNWSANLGLIAGAYLTVGGRNTIYFRSGVIAINYYQ